MIRATMAIVFAAILAGMPSRAIAQGDEEAAVMEVVGALFDAMRAGEVR